MCLCHLFSTALLTTSSFCTWCRVCEGSQRVSALGARPTSPMHVLRAVASLMVPVDDPRHAHASLSPVETSCCNHPHVKRWLRAVVAVVSESTRMTSPMPGLSAVALLRVTVNDAHHAYASLLPVLHGPLDHLPFLAPSTYTTASLLA